MFFEITRNKSDVNCSEENPLASSSLPDAAKNGDLELVQHILSFTGRDSSRLVIENKDVLDALHMAAEGGHLNVVRSLVGFRDADGNPLFDVNDYDINEGTILHWAAKKNNVELVRSLAKLRDLDGKPLFDMKVYDRNGQTAFHVAAKNNHIQVVRCFLEFRDADGNPLVDVNQIDCRHSETAFHMAAKMGYLLILQCLVELEDAAGRPLVDVNQRDHADKTALYYAARRNRIDIVWYLIALRDANGYPAVDVNAANVLQFFDNNLEMRKALRAIGCYENPKQNNEPKMVIQNADEHRQNVHSWFDVKCGAKNLEALLRWRNKLGITQSYGDAFEALKKFVEEQIHLLDTEKRPSVKDKLILALIPPDYPKPQMPDDFEAIAKKLGDALVYFEGIDTPGEWHNYLDQKPDGSDSESVPTEFVRFTKFKDVIGLMWQVLSSDGFIQTIPGDTLTLRQHHKESFIQAFLTANACAKGRTSKVFHRILEGVACPDFTTRSKLIYAFAEAKRQYCQKLDVSDFCALIPDITEDLLRKAYLNRSVYPNQFNDLLQYLNGLSFLELTDKDNPKYAQHFGVRGHVFGNVKEYLYNHFPKGYPRQHPNEEDYHVSEEYYAPKLFYTDLNEIMDTAIDLNHNKWTGLDDFLEAIHRSIQNKIMLPAIPVPKPDTPDDWLESLDDDWRDTYNRHRDKIKKVVKSSDPNEKKFQFEILSIATRSSRNSFEKKKNQYQSKVKQNDNTKGDIAEEQHRGYYLRSVINRNSEKYPDGSPPRKICNEQLSCSSVLGKRKCREESGTIEVRLNKRMK